MSNGGVIVHSDTQKAPSELVKSSRGQTNESEVSMVEHSIANEGPIEVGILERISSGRRLLERYGWRIEWVDEDRCKVPSSKHSDHHYLVVLSSDGDRCNCADHEGDKLGTCKHRVAARILWRQRSFYRVVKRHDSIKGFYVWDLLETKGGIERPVGWFQGIGDAYAAKWAMEESA